MVVVHDLTNGSKTHAQAYRQIFDMIKKCWNYENIMIDGILWFDKVHDEGTNCIMAT